MLQMCEPQEIFKKGVPYKAENWHALSHEQYILQHRFLDICRCAFLNEY